MGGASSALSMGYAVIALIVLYLVVTAIYVAKDYLKKSIKRKKTLKSEEE